MNHFLDQVFWIPISPQQLITFLKSIKTRPFLDPRSSPVRTPNITPKHYRNSLTIQPTVPEYSILDDENNNSNNNSFVLSQNTNYYSNSVHIYEENSNILPKFNGRAKSTESLTAVSNMSQMSNQLPVQPPLQQPQHPAQISLQHQQQHQQQSAQSMLPHQQHSLPQLSQPQAYPNFQQQQSSPHTPGVKKRNSSSTKSPKNVDKQNRAEFKHLIQVILSQSDNIKSLENVIKSQNMQMKLMVNEITHLRNIIKNFSQNYSNLQPQDNSQSSLRVLF